jgi:hypothetical protein
MTAVQHIQGCHAYNCYSSGLEHAEQFRYTAGFVTGRHMDEHVETEHQVKGTIAKRERADIGLREIRERKAPCEC